MKNYTLISDNMTDIPSQSEKYLFRFVISKKLFDISFHGVEYL
ncbi:hypothetical protein J2795_002054 [Chryseobacterium bernardetii]|jgi:hypothetical protein|uniref:Uncharacterized protein n=1 Tax=Chryseobacterium bernardetii TaxID=1241978 RepID=A0ACC6IUT4_9FLAO|nr:hypothetical protein [Chryseobacterium vietnamense]MDR6441354.1 hypothetical protein [Chryseobacterium bernardetii]MDR6461581.1 hypothetical protein [Chryseobacterium sediminis]